MAQPYFTIIIVCLNPGGKLKATLDSVLGQSFLDFEVVIKDGLSEDGSLGYAYALAGKGSGKIKIVRRKDTGIYDAMNQAACEAQGRYLYFLNCGDRLYSPEVLREMRDFIEQGQKKQGIYYGNIYEKRTRQVVFSNPRMDAFGCYRNVPCHQACFYSRDLILEHPFETKYRVRADYEQFLWCFFSCGKDKLSFAYKELIIADYEGGGFSETKENRRISRREHREITGKYMPRGQLFRFKMAMLLTLAPLRTWIAENERTAGLYDRLKKAVYSHRSS